MKKAYSVSILLNIDINTLNKLDNACHELGHTRSLFIREAINRRIFDYEAHERPVILSLPRTLYAPRDR